MMVLVQAASSSSPPEIRNLVPTRMTCAPLEDGFKCSIGTHDQGGGRVDRDDAGAGWEGDAPIPGPSRRAPLRFNGGPRPGGAEGGSRAAGAHGRGAAGGGGRGPRRTAARIGGHAA